MIIEDIIELSFVLPWVRLFYVLDLPVLFYFELINVFIKLSYLVHETLVTSTMFTHFLTVLF